MCSSAPTAADDDQRRVGDTHDHVDDVGGQIDMTAGFTFDGDSRVGGPFITIETCATAPTTASTSTPPDAVSTTPSTVLSPSTG